MDDIEKCVRQIVATSDVNVITKRMVLKQYKELKGVERLLTDEKKTVRSILDGIVQELAKNPELLAGPAEKASEKKKIKEEKPDAFTGYRDAKIASDSVKASSDLGNTGSTTERCDTQGKLVTSGVSCKNEESSHPSLKNTSAASSYEEVDKEDSVDDSESQKENNAYSQNLKNMLDSATGTSDEPELHQTVFVEDNPSEKSHPNKENNFDLNHRLSNYAKNVKSGKKPEEISFVLNHSLNQTLSRQEKDYKKLKNKPRNLKFLTASSVREVILDSDYSVDGVDTSESEYANTPQKRRPKTKDNCSDSKQTDCGVKTLPVSKCKDVYDIESSSCSELPITPVKRLAKSKSTKKCHTSTSVLKDCESDCQSLICPRNQNCVNGVDMTKSDYANTAQKKAEREQIEKSRDLNRIGSILEKTETSVKNLPVSKYRHVYDFASSSSSELCETPMKPIMKTTGICKNSSCVSEDSETDCESPVHPRNHPPKRRKSRQLIIDTSESEFAETPVKNSPIHPRNHDCDSDSEYAITPQSHGLQTEDKCKDLNTASSDSTEVDSSLNNLPASKCKDVYAIASSSSSELYVTPVKTKKSETTQIRNNSNIFLEDNESDFDSPVHLRNHRMIRRRSKQLIIDTSESEFAETPLKNSAKSVLGNNLKNSFCTLDGDEALKSDLEVILHKSSKDTKTMDGCSGNELHSMGSNHCPQRKRFLSSDSEDSDVDLKRSCNFHDKAVEMVKQVNSCDRDSVGQVKDGSSLALTPIKQISKKQRTGESIGSNRSGDTFLLSDESCDVDNHQTHYDTFRNKLDGGKLKRTHGEEEEDVFSLSDGTDNGNSTNSRGVAKLHLNAKSYSSDRYGSDVRIEIVVISSDHSDIEDIEPLAVNSLDLLEDLDRKVSRKMRGRRKIIPSRKKNNSERIIQAKAKSVPETIAAVSHPNNRKKKKVMKSSSIAVSNSSSSSDSECERSLKIKDNASQGVICRTAECIINNDRSSDDEKPLVILVDPEHNPDSSSQDSDSSSLEESGIRFHSPFQETKTKPSSVLTNKSAKATPEKADVAKGSSKKKGRRPSGKNPAPRRRVSKGKKMSREEERLKLEEELRQLEGSEGFREAAASHSFSRDRSRTKTTREDKESPEKLTHSWKRTPSRVGNIFENLRDIVSDEDSSLS